MVPWYLVLSTWYSSTMVLEYIEGFELSDEVLKELRGDEVESAATGFEPKFYFWY